MGCVQTPRDASTKAFVVLVLLCRAFVVGALSSCFVENQLTNSARRWVCDARVLHINVILNPNPLP